MFKTKLTFLHSTVSIKPFLSAYPLGRMNLYADLTLGILPKSLRIPQKLMRLKILLCLNPCGRQSVMQGAVTAIFFQTPLCSVSL